MGRESHYCTGCRARLGETDFAQGRAFKFDLQPYCLACLPDGASPDPAAAAPGTAAPAPERDAPVPHPRASRDEIRPASTRRAVKAAKGGGSRIWIAAAVAAVLVCGAWFILGGRASEAPAGVTRKPPPPVAAPRSLPLPAAPATPAAPGFEEEAAVLEARVRSSLTGGRFREAEAILEEVRARGEDSKWTSWIAGLEHELAGHARERLQKLVAEAKAAAERKDPDGVRKAREEIAAWGPACAALVVEFERAMEPPKPAEAPASPAALAYVSAWPQAMALASAGDFRRAADRLRAAGKDSDEEAVRSESARDLENLSLAQRLHSEILEALPKVPSGTELDLEVVQEDGTRLAWKTRVAKTGPRRLELHGTPRFVEYADLTLRCIAGVRVALEKGSLPEDIRRGLRVLRVLDGDTDPAAGEGLPPKYAKYAASRRDRPAEPDREALKKEWEARRLFYDAEIRFQDPKTRAAALAMFQRLLDEFGSTGFVERCREEIRPRMAAADETFLPALGLSGDGIFKYRQVGAEFKRKPLALGAWSSTEEPPSEELVHHVDVEFYAVSGRVYRGWVLLGGCCKATFTWLLQGTELTWVDTLSRKKFDADPSGTVAVPWNVQLKGSLLAHAGPKHEKEQKRPARWEWAELPLPKYASGGLKRIRMIGLSKGMAVGLVVVSSTRTQPPEEDELRPLEEATPADLPAVLPAENPRPEEWLVLGLFDGKPSLPDPANVKLKYERSEIAKGPLEWKPAKAALSEQLGAKIDFHQLGIVGKGSAFAMIHVRAPKAAKVKLHYGHDDDMLLLVNGREVKDEPRWGTGTVMFDLAAGWNRLVFRIWDNGKAPGMGDFYVSARVTDPSDQPVPGLGFDAYGPLKR